MLPDKTRNNVKTGYELLNSLSVAEICDFSKKNTAIRNSLMTLNIRNYNKIVGDLSGALEKGLSDSYNPEIPFYEHSKEVNYLENTVKPLQIEEKKGKDSTRFITQYVGDPYNETVNLYPDELDVYTLGDVWDLSDNENTLLSKTKKLFNDLKINTLISRFGTNADSVNNKIIYQGQSRTMEYGESHGRNLLTKKAEKSGGQGYQINGYNNPYCRVWTHHYMYDQLYKTIRPFSERDNDGKHMNVDKSNSVIHKWSEEKWVDNEEPYNWKNGIDGWNKSVMNKEGFINFTPVYNSGGSTNIHTKDCMFSIENLAWKGFDPYSFETALSWEQRGPNGGRIMWFPPYGISFNETTTANWNEHSFIGRGEKVYTYTDTVRSGSLSFMMLTDHPSIINFLSWYDTNKQDSNGLKETDLLRFFAGCDSMNPEDEDSILKAVKPTPLTDEYTQIKKEESIKNAQKEKEPELPEPEVVPADTQNVSFYVFYPNNYSGYYDYPLNESSHVDTIAYLLGGYGAQKSGDSDIELTFENLGKYENRRGYEIGSTGVSGNVETQKQEGNYISGNVKSFVYRPENNAKYVKSTTKLWYHRSDGEYKIPKGEEIYKNTWGQTLYNTSGGVTYTGNKNYEDTVSFKLNSDISVLVEQGYATDEKSFYSLTDVMCAIASISDYTDTEAYLASNSNTEKVTKLKDIFNLYDLDSIKVESYSNKHGYNNVSEVNRKRNTYLATYRGNTIIQWLKKCLKGKWSEVASEADLTSTPDMGSDSMDKYNTSSLQAKLPRSAKVTMSFKRDSYTKVSETNQTVNKNIDGIQRYVGFNKIDGEKDLYRDLETNKVWRLRKNGDKEEFVLLETENQYELNSILTDVDYNRLNDINNASKLNTLRYDQEYHFFKEVKKDHSIVRKNILDKIKYFDPAFHSMTPEGFNMRLTFLNQCTRQGNTVTSSDNGGKTANNLAFGRPPFCVLRLGDFYNQMIVIKNINIDYNVSGNPQWDLNPEGAGVQPMLCNVTMNFDFIGGGDLGGAVRRLQNAMTFNYYANTRLYDNRADRIAYEWDEQTGQNGKVADGSYSHVVGMDKRKKK